MFKSYLDEIKFLTRQIDKKFDNLDAKLHGINRTLSEIKTGLGFNLESLSAEFLKHLLKSRGVFDANVTTNYILQIPSAKTCREIDVYCSDPKIIIECTSFLSKKKKRKLERFVETRNFLESDGIPCKETYFVCYGIDPEIYEQSIEYMEKNRIILLNANGILK